MNYQQAIAAAIRQIRFRSVAVDADATATTVSVAGSGFLSFCPAAVAATTDSVDSAFPMDAAVDVAVKATATTVSVAGSGFLSFCPAAVVTTTVADAAAAKILSCGGPFIRTPIICTDSTLEHV